MWRKGKSIVVCVKKAEYETTACETAKRAKQRGFSIIPWIKMLNYPSISTKLS